MRPAARPACRGGTCRAWLWVGPARRSLRVTTSGPREFALAADAVCGTSWKAGSAQPGMAGSAAGCCQFRLRVFPIVVKAGHQRMVSELHPQQNVLEGADVFNILDRLIAAGIAKSGLAVPVLLGQQRQ